MGLIRKVASVSTLGAVDFRSDKERTARYTKKQLKLMEQERDERHAAPARSAEAAQAQEDFLAYQREAEARAEAKRQAKAAKGR
jgi:hypothetical protein